jgi:hypothetical protein
MDWSPSSHLTAYLATFQWMAAFVHPEGEVWLLVRPPEPSAGVRHRAGVRTPLQCLWAIDYCAKAEHALAEVFPPRERS